MPTIAEYVSNYSANLHYRHLPADTVHLLKRMMIDTIGCAIGGYTSEPAKIARDLAGDVTGHRRPVTIIGSGLTSSPELATFANGVMIRYLDFNDGYTTLESGHPSDSIAATLAGAELADAACLPPPPSPTRLSAASATPSTSGRWVSITSPTAPSPAPWARPAPWACRRPRLSKR